MKPIVLLLLPLLISLLSGCSNTYRSTTTEVQQKTVTQHTKVVKKETPAKVKVKKVVAKSPNPSSQKAKKNVVVNKSPRELVTKTLHSMIGRPYKWGGTNPKEGFDCSGLMGYVHKRSLGIDIPRTAAAQRDKSRTIDYANLKAGDMLFFKINRRTNHVGMYIGDRKFIHAATGKKQVRVASMDSPYWHKRFVKFGTFL